MSVNTSLFLLLNAVQPPGTLVLYLVRTVAEIPLWFLPLVLGLMWGKKANRPVLLTAILSAGLAVLISVIIGHIWPTPRPFVAGIGHTWVPHAASASFPSDHAVLMWSVAFTLLLTAGYRKPGVLLLLAGFAVAWARIFLGVHFPVDMLGSFVVALLSAWCMTHQPFIQRLIRGSKSDEYSA